MGKSTLDHRGMEGENKISPMAERIKDGRATKHPPVKTLYAVISSVHFE